MTRGSVFRGHIPGSKGLRPLTNSGQEMEKGKIPCAMLRKRFHARRPPAFAPGRSSTNIQIAGIPCHSILTWPPHGHKHADFRSPDQTPFPRPSSRDRPLPGIGRPPRIPAPPSMSTRSAWMTRSRGKYRPPCIPFRNRKAPRRPLRKSCGRNRPRTRMPRYSRK